MATKFVIERFGDLNQEQEVVVVVFSDHSYKRTYLIDPQKLHWETFGVWLPRDFCMISFAAGLKAAGGEVVMKHNSSSGGFCISKRWVKKPPQNCQPDYFRLGLAWGLGKLEPNTLVQLGVLVNAGLIRV